MVHELDDSKICFKTLKKLNFSIFKSKEDIDLIYGSWKKFYLNDNASKDSSLIKNKGHTSKKVVNYLARLMSYCKTNASFKEEIKSTRTMIETEKYSMYTKIAVADSNESTA